MSYLLSGGLEMVAPWVPQGHIDHPLVKIEQVPSIQMDFGWLVNDTFDDIDCDIFGEYGFRLGIRLCVAEDTSATGSFRAGMFVNAIRMLQVSLSVVMARMEASATERSPGIFEYHI
jgi:hypothetical protein